MLQVLSLFVFLFGFCCVDIQCSNDYFYSMNKEWGICSPILKPYGRGGIREEAQSKISLNTLESFGVIADKLLSETEGANERLDLLRNVFSSVDRDSLVLIIDEILHDEALLERVTHASYRNAIGFLKIVLATGGDESWKIRLHVWEQKEQKEFPHNHKWHFYSKIVTGYLNQEIYTKINTACSVNQYSVREPVSLMPISPTGEAPCPCRDDYILATKNDKDESVSLVIERQDIIATGESYFMPHHLIHSITPGRDAISLVFTSHHITNNSEVFVPEDVVHTDLSRNAPSVTKDELKLELIRIKKLLGQLQIKQHYLPEMVDHNHHYYRVNYDDEILKNVDWRKVLHNKNTAIQKVVQLSEQEKKQFLISLHQSGKIYIGNKPIDPTKDYLFVLFNDQMYGCPKDFNHGASTLMCHTSFTDYGPVDSVGVLRFNGEGYLSTIEAYSGHYEPSVQDMHYAYNYLKSLGMNMDGVSMTTYHDRVMNK